MCLKVCFGSFLLCSISEIPWVSIAFLLPGTVCFDYRDKNHKTYFDVQKKNLFINRFMHLLVPHNLLEDCGYRYWQTLSPPMKMDRTIKFYLKVTFVNLFHRRHGSVLAKNISSIHSYFNDSVTSLIDDLFNW